MDLIKKYFNLYSMDAIGYAGSALIGAGLGFAFCKLI